jgi:hypothetical protein
MDLFFSDISKILDDDLEQIGRKFPDFLTKVEKSISRITTCLNELKEYICKNPFQACEDEIFFFKEIKPSIFRKLIFFVEVLKIESKRPVGNFCHQKKYLLREQKKLRSFFDENVEFYTYCRNKSTHLDEKYFLRNKLDLHLCLDDYFFNSDPCFSTSHDYKVARILANDMLNTYLNGELQLLDQKKKQPLSETSKCKSDWTDPKIGLIELVYALVAKGCINNGSCDIKEIMHLFESIFNIDLGDFYRTFLEIKTRQNPTKFLDSLRSALINKIEEQDE